MENTALSAREIVDKAMAIAGKICIYTNDSVVTRSWAEGCDGSSLGMPHWKFDNVMKHFTAGA